MRTILLGALLSVGLIVVNAHVDHMLRRAAQHSPGLYRFMLASDALSFTVTGGGAFTYANRSKWEYAQWCKSPERTTLDKALFWDHGFLYDVRDPPKEYPYPPLF